MSGSQWIELLRSASESFHFQQWHPVTNRTYFSIYYRDAFYLVICNITYDNQILFCPPVPSLPLFQAPALLSAFEFAFNSQAPPGIFNVCTTAMQLM